MQQYELWVLSYLYALLLQSSSFYETLFPQPSRKHGIKDITLSLARLYTCCIYINFCLLFILCSFHDWENTSNSKRDKHLSHWHPTLPALHPCCCHWWSECHCLDAGHHFSELSQLTPSNLFAARTLMICACTLLLFWQVLLVCNNSHNYYAQHNQHKPSCRQSSCGTSLPHSYPCLLVLLMLLSLSDKSSHKI